MKLSQKKIVNMVKEALISKGLIKESDIIKDTRYDRVNAFTVFEFKYTYDNPDTKVHVEDEQMVALVDGYLELFDGKGNGETNIYDHPLTGLSEAKLKQLLDEICDDFSDTEVFTYDYVQYEVNQAKKDGKSPEEIEEVRKEAEKWA